MAPGGEGGPLRPGDETSLPYCAAQRNMDNGGCGGAPAGPGRGIPQCGAPAPAPHTGAMAVRGGVAFDVGCPTATGGLQMQ